MPTILRVFLGIYADDTVQYENSKCKKNIVKYLNAALKAIENWYLLWRIKINNAKGESVLFTVRRALTPGPPQMFWQPISWKNSVKYLGQIWKKSGRFNMNVKDIRSKSMGATFRLHPIINRNSSIKPDYGILIYNTFIRLILTYDCTVWGGTSETNISNKFK